MSEAIILVVAIVLGTGVMAWSAATSLARSRVPDRRRSHSPTAPARFLCPATDEFVQVRLGLDPAGKGYTVDRCERFPTGPITCDRGCMPVAVHPAALRN